MTDSPTAIESDDGALLQYERLRLQALTPQEVYSERTLGMALFIRKGMLSWMEVCHQCLPATPKPNKHPENPFYVYQATSEMIKVMANITLFNLDEVMS